jgi:hypothetical protein
LEVRHGKGDRARVVKLSPSTTRAIVRWDRERARTLGAPEDTDLLFITVGRRGRDGSYHRRARCGQAVLAEIPATVGFLPQLCVRQRYALVAGQ